MINSMGQFLDLLESRGDLVRVRRPMEDGHEIFSVLWRLTEMGGGPAVVFEDVPPWDIPVVSNLFGTLDRFALACGFEPGLTIDAYRDLFLEKMDPSTWQAPVEVSDAPCQEVVLKGDEVDLGQLPILRWHPDDGGPYITMPLVIAEDPRHVHAHLLLGTICQGRRRSEEAIRMFEKVLELSPGNTDATTALFVLRGGSSPS